MSVGRRTFIIVGGTAVVGAGTYAWLRRLGYEVDPSLDRTPLDVRPKSTGLQTVPFDPVALGVLTALVDRLIPGDPERSLPSATEAGVLDYLLSAARQPGLLSVRNEVLKLTRLFDIVAKKSDGAPFAELEPQAQARIMKEAAAGEHDRGRFKSARAMEATLLLCLEGYLGHPHHGGNRGAGAWEALSIPMPRERTAHHGG